VVLNEDASQKNQRTFSMIGGREADVTATAARRAGTLVSPSDDGAK
jgi:hypothetical protein